MSDLIDKVFFRELAEKDPKEVCQRALCSYNDVKKSYNITIWGDDFSVFPYEYKIDCISKSNAQPPYEYFYLFVIHYLLTAKKIEISKEWVSEKDIPGGAAFFRGPHEIPTSLIVKKYHNDLEKFKKNCILLGGIPLDMADAACVFNITPRIPAALLYWEGDEEFPPESKLLFDRSVSEHLALDIIYALAVDICTRACGL